MGSARVTRNGTVILRGVHFDAENIRAAMLETGGKPVSDATLNKLLDQNMAACKATGKKPEALAVDSIPDVWFVPIEINLHNFPGGVGIPSGGWIYFAVPKKLVFDA